jgi:hypothetical protein
VSVNLTDVLQAVNGIRVACGGDTLSALRPGNHSAQTCPLANSLKDVLPGVSVSNIISGVPRERAYAVAAASDGSVQSINGKADVCARRFSHSSCRNSMAGASLSSTLLDN